MRSIIVVGFIPTQEGEAALRRAREEAVAHSAKLIVVNSSKSDAVIDDDLVGPTAWRALESELRDAGVEYRLVQPSAGHEPADLLLDTCEENQADLVVIGLRRRSAVGKFLLGSTAQRILMQAGCDILSVRAS